MNYCLNVVFYTIEPRTPKIKLILIFQFLSPFKIPSFTILQYKYL